MNVLVTGAARGLGFSLTRLFLVEGATVFACVRSVLAAKPLLDLQINFPDTLHVCEMDIRDESNVIQCAEWMSEQIDALDVLVNNAGVLLGRDHFIEDVSMEDFQESLEVNTLGPIRVVKYFMRLLKHSLIPVVVNVSSEAGSLTTCGKNNYSYCVSKTALNMFSHILRNELNAQARVYALHPGRMRTDMGVPEFPLHPDETAAAVYSLVTGQSRVDPKDWFINLYGEAMPL